jgi:hypothetical protein
MVALLTWLLLRVYSGFKSQARLEAENMLLRQQVIVLRRRCGTRVRLRKLDRLIWRGCTDCSRRWRVPSYMEMPRRPSSQGWTTFLRNHAAGLASIDLFAVRTISFKPTAW